MKVLLTLVLVVLLLAGCAAGKGDGAASATTKEETTANGTEETTILTGEVGLPRPPDSTLSYGGQEVKGTLGSYCWFSGGSGVCADAPWPLIPSKQKMLTVPSGSEMVFRYGGQSSPKTVEVTAYPLNQLHRSLKAPGSGVQTTPRVVNPPHRSLKAHGSGVQRIVPAELSPGEYLLEVFLREQQDDASYYFRIMVE
jgi:hypothetical protein